MARTVHDPALASNAVEETLRAKPRTSAMPRYARTDLEIGGVTIKAGDLVLLSIAAANHDPSVFADPDRVDITRPAAGHLSFGHGARYCIGAPLAGSSFMRCSPNSLLGSRQCGLPWAWRS